MTKFILFLEALLILSLLVLLPLDCDALLLLESVERPLYFTHHAPREAHIAVAHSEVSEILDWHMISDVHGLQLRVAFLLRSENFTDLENTGPFLVAIGDIVTKCLHVPASVKNAGNSVSVTLSASLAAIQVLYTCGFGDASGSLNMLMAHWRDGNLTVTLDEPVFSLGVTKGWLLPHGAGEADAQLLYVQSWDGTTSGVLLERKDPLGVYPSSISRLTFPQKATVRDAELVSSCFLPSVGVSGVVRHSRMEDTFYFELYRVFSSKQSAELLLETSTATFTDLDSTERRYCSVSSRVAFTDCRLTLSSARVLVVEITLTATLESPTASAAREIGDWVKCGTALLRGRAVISDGGLRVHVSPPRRAQFQPVPQTHTVNAKEEEIEERDPEKGKKMRVHTRGRMSRCLFHHNDKLHCDNNKRPLFFSMSRVSRHCLAMQMWWRSPPTRMDQLFCDWLGLGVAEVFTFAFVLFTATFTVQFSWRLLLLRRCGRKGGSVTFFL